MPSFPSTRTLATDFPAYGVRAQAGFQSTIWRTPQVVNKWRCADEALVFPLEECMRKKLWRVSRVDGSVILRR